MKGESGPRHNHHLAYSPTSVIDFHIQHEKIVTTHQMASVAPAVHSLVRSPSTANENLPVKPETLRQSRIGDDDDNLHDDSILANASPAIQSQTSPIGADEVFSDLATVLPLGASMPCPELRIPPNLAAPRLDHIPLKHVASAPVFTQSNSAEQATEDGSREERANSVMIKADGTAVKAQRTKLQFSRSFVDLNNNPRQSAPNTHRKQDLRKSKSSFGLKSWIFGKGDQREKPLFVNINALRNHWMRALASLLCGFDKYSRVTKLEEKMDIDDTSPKLIYFDLHGFLGSRQQFNYIKIPLEELLQTCDSELKDEIQIIISYLQLNFDIYFIHELFIPPLHQSEPITHDTISYNPSYIHAQGYLREAYRACLPTMPQESIASKSNTFLFRLIPSVMTQHNHTHSSVNHIHTRTISTAQSMTAVQKRLKDTNPLRKSQSQPIFNDFIDDNDSPPPLYRHNTTPAIPNCRTLIKPARISSTRCIHDNILSCRCLSQFLDKLLVTSLWDHFIASYNVAIDSPCSKNNDSHSVSGNDEHSIHWYNIHYFYFNIALKAYKMDRNKLRLLRQHLLQPYFEKIPNRVMYKPTIVKKRTNQKGSGRSPRVPETRFQIITNTRHCGFRHPWSVRFVRDRAESLESLQTVFRENYHMIVVRVSWNWKIGAVIGYQSSNLLFETWLAAFLRRLEELSGDDSSENDLPLNSDNRWPHSLSAKHTSLSQTMGLQILVRDIQSLRFICDTLNRRSFSATLGGLHPSRVWITGNVANATQSMGIAQSNLLINASEFFNQVNKIPQFTICLSWATRSGGVFTRQHIEDMRSIVKEYLLPKNRLQRNSQHRLFCFNLRASHLAHGGDAWTYIHELLLDEFSDSCVVFSGEDDGMSVTSLKWLSAHFPVNRSFYSFENDDIRNDLVDLDQLHHTVESTKTPLWQGKLAVSRALLNSTTQTRRFRSSEEKMIYENGGVLSEEWTIVRFLERSKVYFYNHRFAVVNRGWIMSKEEMIPPWQINGRAIVSGFTQLHILFRSPGAIDKPTNHGNVPYGIRASITTRGEFALETVRLDSAPKKQRQRIRVNYNSDRASFDNKSQSTYFDDSTITMSESSAQSHMPIQPLWKYTSDGEFIFPHQSNSANMHTMAFNFELIDYGALHPIEFSVEQLSVSTGRPISPKQTISMQVPYLRDDVIHPWHHYIVFNSHQNADWPILVDRLVIDRNVTYPIKNAHLLTRKKFQWLQT